MSERIETSVLVVGAGPVGLTLAMDLAWRGIDVTVVERRAAHEPPGDRCNQISARSMEIFRRLGVARALRNAGLPPDYPNDVVSCTSVTGIELSRVKIPCRAERYTSKDGPDTGWPTPEPSHRISQSCFQPILLDHARAQPLIRLIHRSEFRSLAQSERGVLASAASLDTGENIEVSCRYLVGCDGGKSDVRKAIGAKLVGTAHVVNVQSTCIKAPDLLNLLPGKRAWLYFALNPRRCGSMIAVDGRETFLIHNFLYRGEEGFDSVDRDWAIRQILGVDRGFTYEVLSKEDWTARRLVADRFRDRRVFICGDAAHLWIPHAGYGMNAGIADAADLAWLLAAVLKGWAAPGLADAYEAERQPITEQVSHFTTDCAHKLMRLRRAVPPEIEAEGPEGDAVRERLGRIAYEVDVEQQCCAGLNFGYFYDRSPIISYDGEQHPPYTMGRFASSTVPGCRLPHLWLAPGHSIYDALGPDYTLMRVDPAIEIDNLIRAAAHRGIPLRVLDVAQPDARDHYHAGLLLVRPDLHIAWRGNKLPDEPLALIDLIRGASSQFKCWRNTQ
jgi:2-polyprenyl-6-methoxyphenol hydroxylase-like FAD-dependent oxidoreductase